MGACYSTCQTENHTNNYYSVGLCSMRGCRRTMEDSHSVHLSIPGHPKYSLFAVFDGFNGNEASTYLSNNLINILSKLKKLTDENIIDAIKKMDKSFLKLESIHHAGSTIVFALIKPFENESAINENEFMQSESFSDSDITSKSYSSRSYTSDKAFSPPSKLKFDVRIFWVADSRSTLITNNNANGYEKLTIDHHCNLESEKKRIIAAAGTNAIINNKINGITELSRSFGCYQMKNNKTLKYNQQKHVCIANVTHKICERGETLLLYCDGLIEKWNTKQVVSKYKHYYNQSKDYNKPMQSTLNYLSEECIDDGSTDNITVIAVQFK